MTPPRTSVTQLYVSTCEADAALRERLEVHLATLLQQGELRGWHAGLLPAGATRDEELERRLQEAQVILLLLSADYLASPCYAEAQRALERHQRGEAWTIPVLLRPVDLHGTPFAQLQALPSDARPVALWRDRDAAWVNVVQGIRQAIAARAPAPLVQDQGGAPLYLCSELLGFTVPLRLALDTPTAVHLERLVRDLRLPERLDYQGRVGLALRYQLAHGEQTLLRGKTLAQQGVQAGAVLVLEVITSQFATMPATRTQEGGLVYRLDEEGPASEAAALLWLRGRLAAAGW